MQRRDRCGRIVLGLVAGLLATGAARAQSGHGGHEDHGGRAPQVGTSGPEQAGGPAPAPHGGVLAEAGGRHFEVVIARDGVTVYPLAAEHQPAPAAGLSGKATFYHPNAPKKAWFARALKPLAPAGSNAPVALGLRADLKKVPPRGGRVAFELAGPEGPARFAVPLEFSDAKPALAVAPATAAEQAAVRAQRTCAVSGEDLSAMGTPVKVSRGREVAFLCCEGCLESFKADPDKFFAAASPRATAAPNPGAHHGH